MKGTSKILFGLLVVLLCGWEMPVHAAGASPLVVLGQGADEDGQLTLVKKRKNGGDDRESSGRDLFNFKFPSDMHEQIADNKGLFFIMAYFLPFGAFWAPLVFVDPTPDIPWAGLIKVFLVWFAIELGVTLAVGGVGTAVALVIAVGLFYLTGVGGLFSPLVWLFVNLPLIVISAITATIYIIDSSKAWSDALKEQDIPEEDEGSAKRKKRKAIERDDDDEDTEWGESDDE